MTDREILGRAVEKAERNNYKRPELDMVAELLSGIYWEDNKVYYEYCIRGIVFSHEFAKAFFGDKLWEYHLQKMVLEENPLKYLERFLK